MNIRIYVSFLGHIVNTDDDDEVLPYAAIELDILL